MRIFTKYVLKEVASHAAIGLALFTFVIFMRDVGRILELIVRNSAPFPSVAELFFLTLPTAFTITLPMAVLVGILIGLSRLASDSEITAMRASGLGSMAFLAMISLFSVGLWLVSLANSVWIAPASAKKMVELQNSLKTSSISIAVQPRVFYENFTNYVLYVQDSESAAGASVWNNVFLADISTPSAPKVTLAKKAIVMNEDADTIRLHLTDATQHETNPRRSDQYNISTYVESDIPIEVPNASTQPQRDPRPAELSTRELLSLGRDPDPAKSRWYMIEFHRRLALPTACLVLALVGIPLGLSSKKGGKSTGFVLTIILVFAYYMVSVLGVAMARQGKMLPFVGAWLANFVFAALGVFLLRRVDSKSLEVGSVRGLVDGLKSLVRRHRGRPDLPRAERRSAVRVSRTVGTASRFPQILDSYVVSSFTGYVALILSSFLVLMLVFTFFELLGDIIKNRVPLITVGEYLLNVIPYLAYNMAPLSVLLAVLVTFGVMNRANEITAMKATGVSIYRVITPVLAVAFLIALGLFAFDQTYLPTANTRQEQLRNTIKGKPAQTFVRPDRKWIFGQNNTIYYYEHFDPDRDQFASVSLFQFDPKSFQITRRIYGVGAHWEPSLKKWVFERGWQRDFQGDTVLDFRQFDVATFEVANEDPTYFKKEVKQSSEMDYAELARYIGDLQQSGFDVVRLKVQLYKKVAYPAIVFVMAVLAVPFSMSAGRKSALTGVATAVAIAIIYWITSGLFEALGNVNQLPAALAAWGPAMLFGMAGGYLILKVET